MVDYVQKLRDDLVEQFKGKPVIDALMEAVGDELNEVRQFYEDLRDKRNIQTAVGKQLDGIGDNAVLTRLEAGALACAKESVYVLDDDAYRTYLIYKIWKNTNNCTYYDIIRAFKMFWDKPLHYREDPAIPATMPAENMTIKAKWTVNQYTLTFDTNGGSTIAPITQDYGTAITAPADPTKTGYTFAGWTPAIPSTMPAENLTVTAQWRYNGGGSSGYSYYTIKAAAGTGGSISPSGNVSVREGKDQTFTITPDKGYAVSNVKIDGKSIGAVKSYTFENVRRTHTIEVIFMKANGNPQTGVFVDVATGSYYEDAVDWAVGNGITQGTDATHFSPDGICTRAQAVTFLWRAAGSPKPETRTMPFTDIPAGSYYYDAVLWAVENGITKGTSDTTFSPNMTCTRAQIVAFLWRSEKSPAASSRNPFADVKSTAYYADAVLWAVREDITKGTTNTTFSPNADCTRAQIVTFLWRCKK